MVNDLEGVLKGAGAPVELYRYDPDHAFFNEQDDAYDAEATALS